MSDTQTLAAARTPTVYFVDDSATMREVIKIAFRRENIHVIACHDADVAIAQFELACPDVIISDVIMPGKDGYALCEFVKQHPQFGATPVILMSGVVDRSVAERAMAARADELVRKPFQPQELVTHVKNLLWPKLPGDGSDAHASDAAQALSSLFVGGAAPQASRPAAASPNAPGPSVAARHPAGYPPSTGAPPRPQPPVSVELQRLRSEVLRLELLIKKLQTELQAEREYCRALEAHVKTLQETE